jgi:hypothetical protein
MSDEKDCTNHFTCEDYKRQLIGLEQKCDGIYDCLDLSDECNDQCSRRIISSGSSLTPFCWTIGILATLSNLCMLAMVPKALSRCRNENVLFSKVLVMLIFAGDLLMGIYLIALSVYDDIIHKETFCRKQAEWFTGPECSVLGVISTVGSQLSLFAMTVLSVFRLSKVLLNALPLQISRRSVINSVSWATLILIISVAMAVIPLIPSPQIEDYLVQGMHYDASYKVFVGLNSKRKHINILEKYYRGNSSISLTIDSSWKDIGDLVDDMFSRNYGNLTRSKVHFYGNDGICMFKFIIPKNDARRGRQDISKIELDNDPIVWAILTVNLICFFVILISAFFIWKRSTKSADLVGRSKNKKSRSRQRSLEIRILAIVVTDFLCWVPFIIICYLHNRDIVDASNWYQVLALVVLPINSLINPLIYDRTIAQICKQKFLGFITSIVSETGGNGTQGNVSPELKTKNEEIQMQECSTNAKNE